MSPPFAHALAPRIAEVAYAAGEVAGDPWAALLAYGPGGLVALLLLTRRLVTGAELERVLKERDQAQADAAALRMKLEDSVIPALTRVADNMAQQATPKPRGKA